MTSDIIVALIGLGGSVVVAAVSLVGVVISNRRASQATDAALHEAQAVTDTKLDELTREVREHNNFARRMPVVEEQVKVINHRLEDLEEFHKP